MVKFEQLPGLFPQNLHQPKPTHPKRKVLLAALLLIIVPIYYAISKITGKSNLDINSESIIRGDVQWHACSNRGKFYECGTLLAPLDYTNSADPRNASIALIRFKAGAGLTPRTDVLGSILFNPGGPGGSGVDFLGAGSQFDPDMTVGGILDSILKSKYDLISFDPRGVGLTYPNVHCFADVYEDFLYTAMLAFNGQPGEHDKHLTKHEIGTVIAESHLLADMCFSKPDSDLLKFMSTPFVARDMQLLHRALGDEKLNYWGLSYGSVLGATYADMFPDDVNRIVIDGVVDAENYYQGAWSDFLKDTEAGLTGFFAECFKSGKEACPLASIASTANELQRIVMDYGSALKYKPIPVASADPPQILTYSTFISTCFTALYIPQIWPFFAEILYEAIANNNPGALVSPMNLHPTQNSGYESHYAICCGDALTPAAGANSSTSWEISDYRRHADPILKDSEHFGVYFAQKSLICQSAWQARGVEQHHGNFTSNTSFPLLALGNEYDPVTPGRYAEKIAARFPKAVSVKREGYGHCSFSQPSKCIEDIVYKYFVHGEVPEPGLKCPVDEPLFSSTISVKQKMISEYIHAYNRVY